MKRARFLFALLALTALAGACSANPVSPSAEDDCPVMGSGSGTCS